MPDELISRLKAVQEELDRGWREVSWVKTTSIHLTLKFLGEVAPESIGKISEALEGAADGIAPLAISVEGVGGFPNLKTPRVIWAGVRENPELTRLQKNIDEGLAALGFEKDDRPFQPHLTLCRIKSMASGRELGRLVGELKPDVTTEFKAASFSLIKSVLSPKGAEYTVLKEVRLSEKTKGAASKN